MASDPGRVEAVFMAACEADDRDAILDQECRGDVELRNRVEQLLGAYQSAGDFLDPATPPTGDFAPPHQAHRDEIAGQFIGPYRLKEVLGEGGMGVVWLAEQSQPVKRRVALKLIKAGMDNAQVLARFDAERQALSVMEHTNIARILDAGVTESGRPYFVMELVKGVPITRYCDQSHLTIRDRLRLFVDVCHAIQHAHQKGIIHRDIKPTNVLVTMQDNQPIVKVIDFGVAKALHDQLTHQTLWTNFGMMIGTLEYMSPEQAELSPLEVDTRSDVYSLGVLLYELLTGSTPLSRHQLKDAGLSELLRLIRDVEPVRPSARLSQSEEGLADIAMRRRCEPLRLARELRGELDWIVLKALDKDRTRRYPTANGLARDVDRYLKDEPVEACPPSTVYHLKKSLRKNRGLAIATLVVLVVLSAGIVGTTFNLMRAKSLQQRAEFAEADAISKMELFQESAQREKAARQSTETNYKNLVRLHENDLNLIRWMCNQRSLIAQPRVRDQLVQHLDREAQWLDSTSIESPIELLRLHNSLCMVYLALDQPDKAHAHAVRHIALAETKLGMDHHLLIPCLLTLKASHIRLGQTELASTARAVSIFDRILTATDAATVDCIYELSRDLREWYDEPQLAMRAIQHVIAARQRQADNPSKFIDELHHLAWAKQRAGENDAAIALERDVAIMARQALGDQHHLVVTILRDAQQLMLNADRLDAVLLTNVREILKDLSPSMLALHGRTLLREQKYAEAEPILRQCLAVRQNLEPNEWPTFNTQSMLGESLMGQRKYADAEPHLLTGYEGLKRTRNLIPIALRQQRWDECMDRLIRLGVETQRPEAVAKWRAEKLGEGK